MNSMNYIKLMNYINCFKLMNKFGQIIFFGLIKYLRKNYNSLIYNAFGWMGINLYWKIYKNLILQFFDMITYH